MLEIALSESVAARRSIDFEALNPVDPTLGIAGLTFSAGDLKVSKNGGAEANHLGTVTEIAGGLYHYAFTAGECDTLGPLSFRVVKAGVRRYVVLRQVGGAEVRGIVTTGGTTTSVPTSLVTPAPLVADQFKGRVIVFDNATTTAALRGQASEITASSASATPTLTVVALTTSPANNDSFSIY